jgi:hypothetical protein
MNLSIATILFAAIVASLIALPAPATVSPPREVQMAQMINQATDEGCSQQTWPNLISACLRYANGDQRVENVRAATRTR